MKKIVCFHLYNDYSGSPVVLSQVIKGLIDNNYIIELHTSQSKGVLSEIKNTNLKTIYTNYKFYDNSFFTFISYIKTQLFWFIYCFRYVFSTNNIFYINTILPIGPAIWAFIFRKKVIYHCHENPDAKGASYKILAYFMKKIAIQIICVSKYQSNKLNTNKSIVVYNSIPIDIINQANNSLSKYNKNPNILMIASLKKYKGIYEFIKLSINFPNYKFYLILNANELEVERFKKEISINNNMYIYSRQKKLYNFYKQSNLLLNLSIPELSIETFGLTVTEAMAFGIPSIVPPIGGIAELIVDGYNGYKIHPKDEKRLNLMLNSIFETEDDYNKLAHNSKKEASKYSEHNMIHQILSILNSI